MLTLIQTGKAQRVPIVLVGKKHWQPLLEWVQAEVFVHDHAIEESDIRLFELVDRPSTPALMMELYAATAEALAKWEPRFKLTDVAAESVAEGRIALTLTGRYLPDGKEIKLEGIVV